MSNGVFRKTDAGRAEIGQRRAGLAPPPEDPQQLLALQCRAYQLLQPHHGPDTPLVAQALLAARSLTGFHEALASLEAKLSIYMRRKQAARAIESLRRMP